MAARYFFSVMVSISIWASAAAATDCKVRPSDLDGFAHYRLGARLKALPKDVKTLPNCAIYPEHRAFDCEFADGGGSSYLASGHEIVRLVRVPAVLSNSPLPRPLQFGMSVQDAVRALSATDPKIHLTHVHAAQGDSLSTGECLRDKYGIVYSLSLEFDKAGGLAKLTAGFDTAEN